MSIESKNCCGGVNCKAGIYAVVDAAGEVWYVGKASNLKNRWGGQSHHRYGQLSRQNKKRNYQIYYRPC